MDRFPTHDWLVVWNMFYFPVYLEQKSQVAMSLQRGRYTTNQVQIWPMYRLIGFKPKNAGKSHDLHGKIGLVSGEDFPFN